MKKTAILFFSQTAAREAASKNFFTKEKNIEFARALISKTQEHLKSSDLPIFHSHEGNQSGRNFGERLTHAFQSLFDKGYESVIAVGNDCPELENVRWDDVETELNLGNAVIGQSARGGAYLIALNKTQFNPATFKALPWCCGQLFESLCAYTLAQQNGDLHLLAILRDINSLSDVRQVLRSSKLSSYFKKIVAAISRQINLDVPRTFRTVSIFLQSAVSFRGPPYIG